MASDSGGMQFLGGMTKEAARRLRERQRERDEMLDAIEGNRVDDMKRRQDDYADIKRRDED